MDRTVKGVLGEKLGMTQVWDENNRVVPVTVVKAGPCVVTQVRTPDTDGYSAVQLGFGAVDPRRVNKPDAGHFAKAGVAPRRHLVELRTTDAVDYTLGQEVGADTFAAGDVEYGQTGRIADQIEQRVAFNKGTPRLLLAALILLRDRIVVRGHGSPARCRSSPAC